MTSQLRAGAARLEITPPVGVDLTGFIARENPNIGVRDPLYVRALVVDDDDRQVAIVSCDLLGFDRALVNEIRDRISAATGIAGPHILLACTHTHGGPATITLIDTGTVAPAYVEWLLPRVSEAVAQAQARLEPATLAAGHTESSTGVHNRRTPGDVIDPEITLLRVDDGEGKNIATLVNYTCHPTTLIHTNRKATADYPGLVTSRLEEKTGGIALFLMGAIGDVGPVTRGEESLATIGNAVADAALAVLPTLAENKVTRVDTASEMLALPLLPLPTREQWLAMREGFLAEALAAEASDAQVANGAEHQNPLASAGTKAKWAMVHWTERMFEAMQDDALRPTVEAEVQALRLGDLVIVGVPGEYFVELGLAIKEGIRQRGVPLVMIAGFANGNVGYIPARRAYPKGGYEVESAYRYYGYPAAIAPEGGETIVASAVKMGSGKE